jgi:hypothetical protein
MMDAKVPLIISAALISAQAAYTSVDTVRLLARDPLIEAVANAPDIVAPGDEVIIEWAIVKRTECPGYSSRIWEGENGFHLSEPVQATSLPSGAGVYDVPTQIPLLTPSGEAKLTIRGHFDCPGEEARYFSLGPVTMTVADGAVQRNYGP